MVTPEGIGPTTSGRYATATLPSEERVDGNVPAEQKQIRSKCVSSGLEFLTTIA